VFYHRLISHYFSIAVSTGSTIKTHYLARYKIEQTLKIQSIDILTYGIFVQKPRIFLLFSAIRKFTNAAWT